MGKMNNLGSSAGISIKVTFLVIISLLIAFGLVVPELSYLLYVGLALLIGWGIGSFIILVLELDR